METRINAKENAIEFYVRDSEYEHCSKKCGHLSLDEAKNFLLDGGCFLLMRYLVQEQFIGTFVALSALVTGWFSLHLKTKTKKTVSQVKRVVQFSMSVGKPTSWSINVCAPSTRCVASFRVSPLSRTRQSPSISNRVTWFDTPGSTAHMCCT